MRLWNPNDPHGIATARRALLWFAAALVVIGANRVLRRGDPVEPFLWLIGAVILVALLMEPVMGLMRPDREANKGR